jgi:hypothetical protein
MVRRSGGGSRRRLQSRLGLPRGGHARPHLVIGAYEQDNWSGFCATSHADPDILPPNLDTCEEDGELIGKDDVTIPLATLLQKLPQPGRSYTDRVDLLGGCDGSTSTSPSRTLERQRALRRDLRGQAAAGRRRSRARSQLVRRRLADHGPMLYFRRVDMLGAEAHADEPPRNAAQPREALEKAEHKRHARLRG